ncbi:YHS domain-containing protein [Marinicella rhabdoformis]|uniref:YHS domain-containing protein n=1 Tax=Marinicella rhabdoformis TaxID=2580566 RepID=UPI0012AEBAD1|nr:YHS domain-containing protein [Marinicella rhabdoformis]
MAGLFSLLIFALFFYLMMRFGCGAHIAHGNHNPDEHDHEATEKKVFIDPICGTKVEDDEGYGMLHEGRLFRFCKKEHLDEFDQNPGKYINQNHSGELS